LEYEKTKNILEPQLLLLATHRVAASGEYATLLGSFGNRTEVLTDGQCDRSVHWPLAVELNRLRAIRAVALI
jgi:hypothetical protein